MRTLKRKLNYPPGLDMKVDGIMRKAACKRYLSDIVKSPTVANKEIISLAKKGIQQIEKEKNASEIFVKITDEITQLNSGNRMPLPIKNAVRFSQRFMSNV